MAPYAAGDGGDEILVCLTSQQQVPAVCQHCLHGQQSREPGSMTTYYMAACRPTAQHLVVCSCSSAFRLWHLPGIAPTSKHM
jgi:hypothetical protein